MCAREIMEYGQLHHIHGVFDEHLEKHKERRYERKKEYYQKKKLEKLAQPRLFEVVEAVV